MRFEVATLRLEFDIQAEALMHKSSSLLPKVMQGGIRRIPMWLLVEHASLPIDSHCREMWRRTTR